MSPRGIFTHVGIILHILDCLGQVYAGIVFGQSLRSGDVLPQPWPKLQILHR